MLRSRQLFGAALIGGVALAVTSCGQSTPQGAAAMQEFLNENQVTCNDVEGHPAGAGSKELQCHAGVQSGAQYYDYLVLMGDNVRPSCEWVENEDTDVVRQRYMDAQIAYGDGWVYEPYQGSSSMGLPEGATAADVAEAIGGGTVTTWGEYCQSGS